MNLTYDHRLIDIAFLVSDCSPDDTTLETVFEYSVALQNGTLVDKLKHEEELKNSGNVRALVIYINRIWSHLILKA